jgi:hypothetical protein
MNRVRRREALWDVPTFQDRTAAAQEQVINHLMKYIRIAHHVTTHNTQKHVKETADDLKDFIAMMKERATNRNKE